MCRSEHHLKAAAEAWGIRINVFKQGLAKKTNDPVIVAANQASFLGVRSDQMLRRITFALAAWRVSDSSPQVTSWRTEPPPTYPFYAPMPPRQTSPRSLLDDGLTVLKRTGPSGPPVLFVQMERSMDNTTLLIVILLILRKNAAASPVNSSLNKNGCVFGISTCNLALRPSNGWSRRSFPFKCRRLKAQK
jgi:hypothetical protein